MNTEPHTPIVSRSASALSRLPISAAIEVVLPGGHALAAADLPDTRAESAVQRIGPLPIAPQRWLWLGADLDDVTRGAGAGAYLVDVEGKWTVFTCAGAAAERALASVVDVDAVLESRRCATLQLFDCPAVLLRAGANRYVVCVHSSYAVSFEAAFAAVSEVRVGGEATADLTAMRTAETR
jgi:sarcosine oxidase gamma subunit